MRFRTMVLLGFIVGCFSFGSQLFATDNLAEKATAIQPLLIGSKLNSVTVQDPKGNPIDLGEAVQEKPTVVVFYRGSW